MKFKIMILSLLLGTTFYAQEVIDKVAAVVDNEIVMLSELNFQTNLFAAQRQLDPNTPGLKEKILNSIIEEKLVLAQAELDSIMVSEDEVEQRLDYQIELFKQQYGSKERVEQIYGMSIERIKRESRDEVRKQLMIQKLREKKFAFTEATRREVEQFFEQFKDSIGVIPEKVDIYHIYKNPKTSTEAKLQFKQKALSLIDSLKAGADFETLARKYSDDPGSASAGGDLGFVKRGVFYPEFESAAFALKEGELSGAVESPVGFHVIQLLEKRGESIHARHILIKIKTDEDADLRAIEFLSEVRDSILNETGTFSDYAKKYSEDEDTKAFGGQLGNYYLNQLDKALLDAVSKLKEGEISFPRRIDYGQGNYGYHLVYIKKRVPQHKAELEKDYTEIKSLADDYKKQQKYTGWITELKDKIYWEVRL
ncbi:MAG: parvulin peptidyl-prolyl isomerase [Ignavibacteria bacterium CG2_30_36_16]|nr:parvulin peptidyl-prolyl isomerase [Ignavibacteria bacterium]OIP64305.1 MAG: parvulin peptidyl-prolyl isomerase [Ignavibacteria bacterium CG2_30_36_16]